ncbi:Apolipoprotein N-acyltransferase [Serinicoccus hydrothermalis]|uniref:Apolipoprotein N-acyltransferase n=1 Tax=Serinicoccus hydrothermalis TaxID=1758689 RepID=A0A1B1N8J5_9MICO|nr:apolipoprotein N-acyltransferase [Serinicoccus hydrothermalis]ANS77750.1 Apolipoprotein N-acyltransferase [Serinicoccus hydrothermalis]
MRWPIRLLLAALGGVALYLAFPSHDIWPLALVGCGALALATAGASVRVGLAAGLLLGLTWYTPMFVWASTYAGSLPWLAMSAASALYPAALGGLLALLQRDGRVRPVVGAAAWVLMEYARSVTPFGGFPWARLGFSQADSPQLGVVALVSVAGLGFAVALTGGLLALALQLLAGRPRRRPALAAVLAVLAAGLVLAPSALPRPVEGDPVQVAAVQGDLPPDFTRTLTAERGTMLERYTSMTEQLAEDVADGTAPAPDLVLWPEGASDLDPLAPGSREEAVARMRPGVEALDAPVVLGATSYGTGDAPRNMVLELQPGQGVDDTYQKIYLAPFGERMPLRPVMRHLSDWVDRIPDWEAGTEPGVMDVALADGREVRLGLGICFEVVVDTAVRDVVAGGAELLVVPTSNAWFGEGDEAAQHIAASRVRAVEYGRSVVHISNVGISGLISPDGTVHERTGLFTQALLEGQLPLRSASTPAETTGPWVVPAAAAVVLVALLGLVVRRPRSGS